MPDKSRIHTITVHIDFGNDEYAYTVKDYSLDAVLEDARATYPDAVRISLSVQTSSV